MENEELLRRMEDLASRCERNSDVTASFFLTPAEQAAVKRRFSGGMDCTVLLSGGREECERKAVFFLPYYLEADYFDPSEYIKAVKIKAGFGEPGHRDYMGALLGLGIRREWLGDIWVAGDTAYAFCLPSVQGHLLTSLDKVGRYGVKVTEAELLSIPVPEKKVKKLTFSVLSCRLDAVCAGMFSISRTDSARQIEAGNVSLNYELCQKPDAEVSVGDIISLRGHGKGSISETGGISRRGRQFLEAEIYL